MPVVLHGFAVVAYHGRARPQRGAGGVEAVWSGVGGPRRGWGERRQRGVPARQFVSAAILLGGGVQLSPTDGQRGSETVVRSAGQHPPSVDHDLIAGHPGDRRHAVTAGQGVMIDQRDRPAQRTSRLCLTGEVLIHPP